MSTASMVAAPEFLAPWIVLMPTPPQPITSTDDPGSTCAALNTAPTPVMTPQPTSDATSKGMSSSILLAPSTGTMSCSANVPAPAIPKPFSLQEQRSLRALVDRLLHFVEQLGRRAEIRDLQVVVIVDLEDLGKNALA